MMILLYIILFSTPRAYIHKRHKSPIQNYINAIQKRCNSIEALSQQNILYRYHKTYQLFNEIDCLLDTLYGIYKTNRYESIVMDISMNAVLGRVCRVLTNSLYPSYPNIKIGEKKGKYISIPSDVELHLYNNGVIYQNMDMSYLEFLSDDLDIAYLYPYHLKVMHLHKEYPSENIKILYALRNLSELIKFILSGSTHIIAH